MANSDKQVKNTGKDTRWKKGQSGNPNGRPKNGLCLTSLAKAMLGEKVPDDPHGRTRAEVIADNWLTMTLQNPTYLKELLERVEGKVPQALEHTGAEGGPIGVMIGTQDLTDEELLALIDSRRRRGAPKEKAGP